MTTIAWDGTTLAADTRCTQGGVYIGHAQKIWRLLDGRLFGACGETAACVKVKNWLNDPNIPPPNLQDSVGFQAILIDTDATVYHMDNHLTPHVLDHPWHATGSGREFALAAMYLGHTAAEAVEVAAYFDEHTGGRTETLTLTETYEDISSALTHI